MYLFGASGHAKVILDILIANGVEVKGFYDDDPLKKELKDIPVLGDTDFFNSQNTPCIISIGNNKIRKKVVQQISINDYSSAIHPETNISPSVQIGKGTVVMASATINADTSIANHVIINTASSVDHDCVIDDFCHIAPNSTLCGGVSVGEGTLVGAGAVVIPGVKIGKWCVIGAGAVVINDVEDYSLVVGNPAQKVKRVEER